MSLPTLEELIEQREPEQSATRLILSERQGDWATALVRLDRDVSPFLCETRSLQQMQESLEISPCSLLGIELTKTNFEAVPGYACLAAPKLSRSHRRHLDQPPPERL